jgi:hypothetical protein
LFPKVYSFLQATVKPLPARSKMVRGSEDKTRKNNALVVQRMFISIFVNASCGLKRKNIIDEARWLQYRGI